MNGAVSEDTAELLQLLREMDDYDDRLVFTYHVAELLIIELTLAVLNQMETPLGNIDGILSWNQPTNQD